MAKKKSQNVFSGQNTENSDKHHLKWMKNRKKRQKKQFKKWRHIYKVTEHNGDTYSGKEIMELASKSRSNFLNPNSYENCDGDEIVQVLNLELKSYKNNASFSLHPNCGWHNKEKGSSIRQWLPRGGFETISRRSGSTSIVSIQADGPCPLPSNRIPSKTTTQNQHMAEFSFIPLHTRKASFQTFTTQVSTNSNIPLKGNCAVSDSCNGVIHGDPKFNRVTKSHTVTSSCQYDIALCANDAHDEPKCGDPSTVPERENVILSIPAYSAPPVVALPRGFSMKRVRKNDIIDLTNTGSPSDQIKTNIRDTDSNVIDLTGSPDNQNKKTVADTHSDVKTMTSVIDLTRSPSCHKQENTCIIDADSNFKTSMVLDITQTVPRDQILTRKIKCTTKGTKTVPSLIIDLTETERSNDQNITQGMNMVGSSLGLKARDDRKLTHNLPTQKEQNPSYQNKASLSTSVQDAAGYEKIMLFACDYCDYRSRDPEDVHKHFTSMGHVSASRIVSKQGSWKIVEPLVMMDNQRKKGCLVPICATCRVIFDDVYMCAAHNNMIHGLPGQYDIAMVICNALCHITSDFTCRLCNQKFERQSFLTKHWKENPSHMPTAEHIPHNHGSDLIMLYSCTYCPNVATNLNFMTGHLLLHYRHGKNDPLAFNVCAAETTAITKMLYPMCSETFPDCDRYYLGEYQRLLRATMFLHGRKSQAFRNMKKDIKRLKSTVNVTV